MLDKQYYLDKKQKMIEKLTVLKDKALQSQVNVLQEYLNGQNEINQEIVEIDKILKENYMEDVKDEAAEVVAEPIAEVEVAE